MQKKLQRLDEIIRNSYTDGRMGHSDFLDAINLIIDLSDELKLLDSHNISGSFIRPMTKACKVCVNYQRDQYPNNEPCKRCNAVKGKDIELWRRPLD